MIQALVALAALIVLVVMSQRANRKFRNSARLPMQWSLGGQVNWTAPRHIALSFTPVLAAFILAAVVILTIVATPRAGQEGYEIPVVVLVALTFIGIHALHLWLLNRTLDRNES